MSSSFKIKKKNKKFIVYFLIILVLIVIVAMMVYDDTHKTVKNVIIEEKDAAPTKQYLVTKAFTRIAHWDLFFEKIGNDDISYKVKDKVENYMSNYIDEKKWIIDNGDKIGDQFIIEMHSEIADRKIRVTLNEEYRITSLLLDDVEKIGRENELTEDEQEYKAAYDKAKEEFSKNLGAAD